MEEEGTRAETVDSGQGEVPSSPKQDGEETPRDTVRVGFKNIPHRRRTKVVGKTRKNPTTESSRMRTNRRKRLIRLAIRVDKFSKSKGAGPIALVAIEDGLVYLTGTPALCNAIEGGRQEKLHKLLTPAVRQQAKENLCNRQDVHANEEVDLRGTSLFIEFKKTKAVHLKEMYSNIFNKQDDGKRLLTGDGLRRGLIAWQEDCLQKLARGYKPINVPDDTTEAEIIEYAKRKFGNTGATGEAEHGEEEGLKKKKNVEEQKDEESLKTEKHVQESEHGVSSREMVNGEGDASRGCCNVQSAGKNFEEVISALRQQKCCTRHYNLILLDDKDSPFHLIFQPDCTPSTRRLGETAETLAERWDLDLEVSTESELRDVLLHEAKGLLDMPSHPRPGMIMYLAGMLGQELFIHSSSKILSSRPCPCSVFEEDPAHFYIDHGDRVYLLVERDIIQDELPTLRQKRAELKKNTKIEHQVIIPDKVHRDSEDKRVVYYKKLEVWQSDLQKLQKKAWIDDHVIDTALLMLKDMNDSSAHIILSSYGIQLQTLPARLDTDVHWILIIIHPNTEKVFILCSMGMRYQTVERNLKRILQSKHDTQNESKHFEVCYPKVPHQTNGYDCGIFVIMFAWSLMMKLQSNEPFPPNWLQLVDPSEVERSGRDAIYELLMTMK